MNIGTTLPDHTIEAIRRLHAAVEMVETRDAIDKAKMIDLRSRKRNRCWLERALSITALLIIAASVTACSTGDTTIYGAHNDTKRGVCAAEGQAATTSLSHGGYVTRCAMPE
jgi:hypothetical protein